MPSVPGTHDFVYSSSNSQLVTAALEKTTGRNALDYAIDHLFGPLGIRTDTATQPSWTEVQNTDVFDHLVWARASGAGQSGWSLLYLTPQNLLRLCELSLRFGNWGGRQIVPESWLRTAFEEGMPAVTPPAN